MNRTLKILSIIFKIIAVIILSCTVFLAGIIFLPRLFGVVPYTVITGSMEPEIPVGALVYINTDNKTPKPGDIIAYTMPNGITVTHRVTDVQNGNFITKGDANKTEDIAPVSASQVLGVYVFHIPIIGSLLLFPALKYGWAAITAAAAIYLIIIKKEGASA